MSSEEQFERKLADDLLKQIKESQRMILEYLAWRFGGIDAGGGGVRGPIGPRHEQLVALGKMLVANAHAFQQMLLEGNPSALT